MSIRFSSDPTRNLFIACEPQDDGGTIFTFYDDFTDEAYNRIHNMLAYLRYTNPQELADGITAGFSKEAQAMADHVTWDPATKSMITPEDRAILNIEDDLDFLNSGSDPESKRKFVVALEGTVYPMESSAPNQRRSDDSVSTFHPTKKTRFAETSDQSSQPSTQPAPTQSTRPPRPKNSDTRSTRSDTRANRDDVSAHSEISLESAFSRISQLEGGFVEIRSLLQQLVDNQNSNQTPLLASDSNNGSSSAGRSS